MKEIWRIIKGFEDYEISNTGRVKSHKHGREVILKQRVSHDGYVWYNLCMNGKQYTKRANRLLLITQKINLQLITLMEINPITTQTI